MRAAGFEVIDRNWRSPFRELPGEIDLIVHRRPLVVFCEVKTRRSAAFGGGARAVDARKQRKLRSLASAWIHVHPEYAGEIRFDVISVDGVTVSWYEAAF